MIQRLGLAGMVKGSEHPACGLPMCLGLPHGVVQCSEKQLCERADPRQVLHENPVEAAWLTVVWP